MDKNKIYCCSCLDLLPQLDDFSSDLIFADPPYNLGSEIIIKPDGKPEYKKAVDFMGKWEAFTGADWEQFFKEAFRTLKYGGWTNYQMALHCVKNATKKSINIASYSLIIEEH